MKQRQYAQETLGLYGDTANTDEVIKRKEQVLWYTLNREHMGGKKFRGWSGQERPQR